MDIALSIIGALIIIFPFLYILIEIGSFLCKEAMPFILLLLIGIGLIAWVITAHCSYREILSRESYPVETVKYKDGCTFQSISVNGKQINITEKFNKMLPENYRVKVSKINHWSKGVYIADELDEIFEIDEGR